MPQLSVKNGKLFLLMEDARDFSIAIDTKLYFSSILGMNFDGYSSYSFTIDDDYVKVAKMIEAITNYLAEKRVQLDLDNKASQIIDTLKKSEKQLQQSIEKGREILSGNSYDHIDIPNFSRTLKSYQIKPVIHAINCFFTANFSVPGSGKTTMAYAAYSVLKERQIVEKIIVIGPRSSFMPWEDEYESCFQKEANSFRIVDSGSQNLIEKISENELILLTYNMASLITDDLIEILSTFNCILVLDESHNVKRFDGGVWAQSVLKIAPFAKRRLILTGTPMPKDLLDLWTQFTFLWPYQNLLGGALSYKYMTEEPNSLNNIREIIFPFYSRVTKNQLDLPLPTFNEIIVPLNRVQKSIYSTLATKALREIVKAPLERLKLRNWQRAKIIRLLQAASNPSLLTEYSKDFRIPPLHIEGLSVVKLIERYSEYEIPSKIVKANSLIRNLIDDGEKVIVWETFVHNIETLGKILDDLDPILIYGKVPRDETENESMNREKRIREFKNDENPRVIIANPMCLAESVSLHKICKHAIYVDRSFNAAQYIQSMDRIHRIGLKPEDQVTYHLLISKDTIDEVVNTRLLSKYEKMLKMLNDDFSILDLDSCLSDVSDSDFDADYKAVQNHLLHLKKGECFD